VIRYGYNRQVTPPAPYVHATVHHPTDDLGLSDLPALLDSGADISVIPWTVVQRLELTRFGEATVEGFDGRQSSVPTFLVRLGIRLCPLVTAKVAASRDEEYILLGREC